MNNSFAQSYSVSGHIIDKKGNSIESVHIMSDKDSVQTNTSTNKDGFFEIRLTRGSYHLRGIYFGDILFEKQLDIVADINLHEIETIPSILLDTIIVKGKKNIIKNVEDKLVFYVQNMSELDGYRVSEILKYIPRVVVSPSGTVTVRNKPATIFLNDRQLSDDEASQYIKNINAKDIEKIEVQITHGGIYSADIQGGIINMITKLPQTGFNGTIKTYNSIYNTDYYQWSPGIDLFYGANNWNFYGFYSNNNSKNMYHSETTNLYTADMKSHTKNSNSYFHNISHTYKIGLMSILNKAHSLGFEFNGTNNVPLNSKAEGIINQSDYNHQKIDDATTAIKYIYNSDFYNASISYIWQIDTLQSSLKLLANYNNKFSYSSSLLDVKYNINFASDVYEENVASAKAENYSFKADFRKNWASKLSLRAGGQYLTSNRKSDYSIDLFDNTSIVPTIWDYDENILSGYAALTKYFGDEYVVSARLRIENTNIKGYLSDNNSIVKQNYTDIFPYLYVSYSKDKVSYSLIYAISIYRPPFELLNNYANRVSDILYDMGNPNLKSQKNYVYLLSFDYDNHSVSVQYSYSPNIISELYTVENGITYHTNINYGSNSVASIDYSFAGKLFSWWQINAYLYGGYTRIPKSYNKKSMYHGDVSLSNRIILKNIGVISLDLSGSTGFIIGNNFEKGKILNNFSFSRSFFNDLFNVQFGINDLFNANRTRAKVIVPDLHYTFYSKSYTRCFWINLSYSFSTKKKIENRILDNDNPIKDRL